MATKLLTDTAIRAAIRSVVEQTKKHTDLRDTNTRGLVLRISPTGNATWVLQYRQPGKPQPVRLRVGPYPAMTLKLAREKVDEHRGEMAKGNDPIEAKRAAEAAKVAQAEAEAQKAARITYKEVTEDYLQERIPKVVNRRKMGLSFNTDMLPALGDKAIADVTPEDVMAMYNSIRRRGAHRQAKIMFDYTRVILNFAVEQRHLKVSPLLGQKVTHRAVVRDRVLTTEEIRQFWRKLDDAPYLLPDHKTILRLQLLLGQRVGEVAGMARSELDMEAWTWTLPPERCKNKRRHVLPLPPMARAMITDRLNSKAGDLLFPTKGGNPAHVAHIANGLLKSQPYFDFKKVDGTPHNFTSHDLRRTVSTKLRELKFGTDIRDAILNHVTERQKSVTEAHYTFGDLMPEMREALATWDAAVKYILDGGDPFAVSTSDNRDIEERAALRFQSNVIGLRSVS